MDLFQSDPDIKASYDHVGRGIKESYDHAAPVITVSYKYIDHGVLRSRWSRHQGVLGSGRLIHGCHSALFTPN